MQDRAYDMGSMNSSAAKVGESVYRIPLFPLPNVVLFPRAILPLHIFEERYKQMTADALGGDRFIAMALLRPGWEKEYYSRPAIDPVVCIGKIASHERLEDGKYNFLLQGVARGRIVGEEQSSPYRIARIEMIPQTNVMEIDLTNQRQRLMEMFSRPPLGSLPGSVDLRKIIGSSFSTGEVVDLLAYHVLSNVGLKQSLLGEGDVARRVARVISALDAAAPILEHIARGESGGGEYN
jgi:Lon protease-like protein